MRNRERGIGNLPFIAVLVLFVISLALFFMARDEADTAIEAKKRLEKTNQESIDQLVAAGEAYDAWVEVMGLADNALNRTNQVYPDENTIKDKVRTFLDGEIKKLEKAGEAKLQNRQYQVDTSVNEVKVIKGDTTTIRLYGTPFAKETLTVKQVLGPLERQFRFAADAIEKNNQLFETEYDAAKARQQAHDSKIGDIQNTHTQAIATLTATNEAQKQQINDVKEQNDNFTTQIDSLNAEAEKAKADAAKKARIDGRMIKALETRVINEKRKTEVALAEDPKDGEILVANSRKDLVYINLGRRNKVSNGTKFKVWRPGKGNVREDIAVIRVIRVDRSKAEARIIQRLARNPVTAGMNISNPFYDPNSTLRVYIFGDLRHYPTAVAKRRLARSGMDVAGSLDDRVNVIILGEPSVAIGEDVDTEDEAGMAAAQRRISAERDKRLFEIKEIAASIGAIVVTEDVLRTFIDY